MLLERTDKKGTGDSDASENRDIPAAITDTGCERDLNEDRYAVVESPSGLAWLVCDGMGGQTGGELAAQLAIDAIRRDLENVPARPPELALKSAILEANRIIVLRRQNQAFAGMGTTIVTALFNGLEVVIAHVGDSRAYLVRDGAIQQLTTDHTYVQQLVDAGQIRADQALAHPQAHILTRCIGAEPGLEIDLQKFWIWEVGENEPTDYLVLCSDGLYSLVSEGDIATIMSQNSPQRACVKLVALAKERGGFDNITLAITPLGGQLRQEPPAGYSATQSREMHSGIIQQADVNKMGLLRIFGIVLVLSILAALLTMLVMAFMITQ
ncbi:protein phosphatase 2C domain-containing protein [Oligoflexia bacterium]|nr:protein phosphatase 2C domain-containing protein [Oligoflexia bacterium]